MYISDSKTKFYKAIQLKTYVQALHCFVNEKTEKFIDNGVSIYNLF